ncbi:MAG: dTMP kinase [Cyanobacteria bacterium P01_H01_bin.74]
MEAGKKSRNRAKKSLFITFEGIDGCGKSTQLALCAETLSEKYGSESVITTRNPGGTEFGKAVRNILLHSTHKVPPLSELFLFLADRAEHLETLLKPALEAGKIVLCDRYFDSTLVYQGHGRGLDLEVVTQLNAIATQYTQPDCTFLFDADPSALQDRLIARGKASDRMEKETQAFRDALRNGFLSQAKQYPARIKVLDALESIEDTHQQVIKAIFQMIG